MEIDPARAVAPSVVGRMPGAGRISQALEGVGRPVTVDSWRGIMLRRQPDAGLRRPGFDESN